MRLTVRGYLKRLLRPCSSALNEIEKWAAVLGFEFSLERLKSGNWSLGGFRLLGVRSGLRRRGWLIVPLFARRGTIVLGNLFSIMRETIGAVGG